MNRKERRAAKLLTAEREERVMRRAFHNANHWDEIKRIKREYDALPDEQKAVEKPALAALIDEHLAELLG